MSIKLSNTTSDFLDWNTMLKLVRDLYDEKNYQISLLIATGCFFGLRISDLLNLTWEQLINNEYLEIIENKTGKRRVIKINVKLQKHVIECYKAIKPAKIENKCFISQKGSVYSVQRINVILKELKITYRLRIEHFSTHSFRKSFGRAIFNNSDTNAEFSLVKLCEIFNHSDIRTTRKYLGLRSEETYDLLTF